MNLYNQFVSGFIGDFLGQMSECTCRRDLWENRKTLITCGRKVLENLITKRIKLNRSCLHEYWVQKVIWSINSILISQDDRIRTIIIKIGCSGPWKLLQVHHEMRWIQKSIGYFYNAYFYGYFLIRDNIEIIGLYSYSWTVWEVLKTSAHISVPSLLWGGIAYCYSHESCLHYWKVASNIPKQPHRPRNCQLDPVTATR